MNARNRVSALKRLSKPVSMAGAVRSQSTPTTNNSIQDARQLLGSRAQTSFDARQLLSRQSSNLAASASTQVMVRKNIGSLMETTTSASEKMVVVTGLRNMKLKDGKVTVASKETVEEHRLSRLAHLLGDRWTSASGEEQSGLRDGLVDVCHHSQSEQQQQYDQFRSIHGEDFVHEGKSHGTLKRSTVVL